MNPPIPLRVHGCIAVLLMISAPVVGAAEPWADARLPVSEGLALWLDASVQIEAHRQHGQRPLEDTGRLATWLDGSGRGRHLIQRFVDSQPRYDESLTATGGRVAVVRFDGEDDCLTRDGVGTSVEAFSAFLVAAPRSNRGYFRAFLAGNALGQNDYTSGFTLDLGGQSSTSFSTFNPEGRGFGGAVDVMQSEYPFGTFHIVRVTAAAGNNGVRLAVDGKSEGSRSRQAEPVSIDGLTLGARFYSNTPEPAANSGFLEGDIAEVLLYDRVLSEAELQSVEQYLAAKYAPLLNAADADSVTAFLQAGELPEVQFLAPGFAVRRLPVDLTNVNDLHCDSAGRLFVLHYDGRISVLTDTNGDGLEDHSEIWWDEPRILMPLGMVLTDKGIVVSQKGKISRLSDSDGDGHGDREEILASGWKPPQNFSGGVDAVGLAIDRDGSIYFALGTSDYANAYLIDGKTGQSHYDIHGERGTIQKVSPDFKTRETFCTGTRFPVSMAFNSRGDLFCSEQEGATWLANGNPFDELLHIERGRHYGFPPRHPKHLPDVIDEPSVFDYSPQHQSTCGLTFNESRGEGAEKRVFGPGLWEDDAFVCGYSRGKLYRTKLVKTEAGYVAQTTMLACLRNLTLDTCLAPDGALVIATHSGGPDWGSGPGGKGTLYKVRYVAPEIPQPTAVWAASPTEVRIAFDRELDPARLAGIGESASITYGPYVRAGDRYEVKRPGYAVVAQQQQAPRATLAVQSVQLTPDRRSLLLVTDPHPASVHYAVRLPWPPVEAVSIPAVVRQDANIEVDYALTGVRADWKAADGSREWSGWLPHPDLAVARELTQGSADHDQFRALLHTEGMLSLSCQLDLQDMLRPAVQPGSQLDYVWPPEEVAVVVTADRPIHLGVPQEAGVNIDRSGDGRSSTLRLAPGKNNGRWLPLTIDLKTRGDDPKLTLTWHTNEDSRPRALPLRRCFLPWASRQPAAEDATPAIPPELAGGSWERGRQLFLGEQAQCSKCHSVRGKGGRIGPDLSNLVHRDYASVLRDVTLPNYALNPDFVSYSVALTDGRVLTGVVRTDGDNLRIGDTKGVETVVARGDVETLVPQSISIMPDGLTKTIGAERVRDVLTYLLLPPPTMPRDLDGTPPVRTQRDVQAVLAGAPTTIDASRLLKIVLVAGPKDHGPGEHDYPAWQRAWRTLLGMAENVAVDTAWEWPSSEQLETADVIVFYQHGSWNDDKAAQIDAYLARGGGLAYIHWAVDGGAEFARRIGLAWGPGAKFRHGPVDLVFDRDDRNPITRNFRRVEFLDESYWNLTGSPGSIHALASGDEEGQPQPLFWTYQPGKGRVFVSILGHYSWTFDDPLFRILLLRGIAWTAGESVDRWNNLAMVGVELRNE